MSGRRVSTGSLDPGVVLVALSMLLIGTTGTSQALGPDGIDPTVVGLLRLGIGGPVLLGFAAATGRLSTSMRRGPLAVAAVSIAAYQPCFFGGIDRTGVAVGTIVALGSSPVFAGVLGLVVRGERPGRRWAMATVLAIAGGALLVGGGGSAEVDPTGIVLALGAGLSYAVFAVVTRGLLDHHPPPGVMAVSLTGAAVLLLPTLAIGDTAWLATGGGIAVSLHLGLVATALAYGLYGFGAARLPVATTTTVTLTEPLTAAVLGMLVLGERLTAISSTGAILLAGGLVVIATGRRSS